MQAVRAVPRETPESPLRESREADRRRTSLQGREPDLFHKKPNDRLTMKPLPVITKDEEIRDLKRMNAKLRKLLTDALDEMVRMSDSRLPAVEKSAK
jgi:hypothetical protein